MSVILDIAATLLSFIMPNIAPRGRGTDRRLMAEDAVRSAIRAVDGRVLNIGTEWSTGVCEITRGHLRFVPRIGIVGNREISVEGLRQIEVGPIEFVAPWSESAHLIISTGSGELHWVIPEHTLDDVIARLRPIED